MSPRNTKNEYQNKRASVFDKCRRLVVCESVPCISCEPNRCNQWTHMNNSGIAIEFALLLGLQVRLIAVTGYRTYLSNRSNDQTALMLIQLKWWITPTPNGEHQENRKDSFHPAIKVKHSNQEPLGCQSLSILDEVYHCLQQGQILSVR